MITLLKKILRPYYHAYKNYKALMHNKHQSKSLNRIAQQHGNETNIFYLGITAHSNLGDMAQYYCIHKWLHTNYPDAKIHEFEANAVVEQKYGFIDKLKHAYRENDIIVFQSGYTTQDLGGVHDLMHRMVIDNMPDAKILMMPQTIFFQKEENKRRTAESYNKAKNMLFLARDNVSYNMAKEMFPDVKVMAYPDIVTSLIGKYNFKHERKGILICRRNDGEKYYSEEEILQLKQNLEKIDHVQISDTKINISYKKLRQNPQKYIENIIEDYSKYQLIITDRYHGTIFSLAANTPVIVIKTTDHKVTTGVDWFKGVYDDHVCLADSLEDVIVKSNSFFSKCNNLLEPYFEKTYYEKLKDIFHGDSNKNIVKNKDITELYKTVVNNGYCIGCGACASIKNSPISIKFDKFLKLQATIEKNDKNKNPAYSVLSVCPFSDISINEDEIGEHLFKQENNNYDNNIGYFSETYAGFVNEEGYRKNGSSGGMVTWTLVELFKNGLINKVAHIHPHKTTEENPKLFEYKISKTIQEIKSGAKSRYYPIEISEIISEIRETPGNYAIVGIPCFIKAIRLLMKQEPVLHDRIKYCIGLVCGHLKSAHFASLWSWQVGIHPSKLLTIDFRTKLKDQPANLYGITAVGLDDNDYKKISTSPPLNTELFGNNWGWGLFKYKACDYCDDVFSETADITLGDAWSRKYMNDVDGTNVIIIRNKSLLNIFSKASSEKRIKLDRFSADEIIKTQNAGINHRKKSLPYRLFLTEKQNLWHPKKRMIASKKTINKRSRNIQILRIKLMEKSHYAFLKALENNSFEIFKKELEPLIKKYEKLYKPSRIVKIKKTIKNMINNIGCI